MEPKSFREKHGPEYKIQHDLMEYLRKRLWYVRATHGNMYSSGYPDLYCCHNLYGPRWIEVKYALKYSFTKAQIENFPIMSSHGDHIWILVAATETEYKKLFDKPNWEQYYLSLKMRSLH